MTTVEACLKGRPDRRGELESEARFVVDGHRRPAAAREADTGTCVLLTDDEGRILIVKPTYRAGWQFPGGTVDHGEDPETCARRELAEETGLDQPMHGILTVTWSPAGPRLGSPAINLVFDAGTVPASTPILLPEHELEAHRRAYPAEAEQLLLPSGALRLRAALRARETGTVQMLRSSDDC
ncbi:NUDIX domain-containing protein [Streptomyces erythrochromogenes]|uniref:NUDIX domain-containing protein n=1 Tax=Streptomyces erythrochromogenes TaxID=285574 RepID=UPI0037035D35